MSSVRNFNTEPPKDYVAGLGRGATGFTTRSDIGPARMLPGEDLAAPPSAGAAGTAGDKPQDLSEGKFDAFNGYEERLFGNTPYEEDDKLADEVWEAVDEQIDLRRRARREKRRREEEAKYRQSRPKIQHQFADLKRELASVSQGEWEALPEPGSFTKSVSANKQREQLSATPDTLLASARSQGAIAAYDNGGETTEMADLASLGTARSSLVQVKLDRMADSVTGQTVVDPKGFLTELGSVKVSSMAEIGDIKKARHLLESVRQTNPAHAPAWIASARIEEHAGRMSKARALMMDACQACPGSEDVWLEAARLQTDDAARATIAEAVRRVPTSVKVWLRAAQLEQEERLRKVVLRRALDLIPNSVKLWQAAIDLEAPEDARLMLTRAVECVPHSVDMWLALARLETYENARKVLNRAREAIPTEPLIWIAALKLEEANGKGSRCDQLIGRALEWLRLHNAVPDREVWFAEAEAAEKAGAPVTAAAILKHTVGLGVEEEDRGRIWAEDADSFLAKGCVDCARAVVEASIEAFPARRAVWEKAALLEKAHGTPEALDSVLLRAVSKVPGATSLWLMAANIRKARGQVEEAQRVLSEAFRANPGSEAVWLAAAGLEFEVGEHTRARVLLSRARDQAGTEGIWLESVALEAHLGAWPEAVKLATAALKVHPESAKLFAAKADAELALGSVGAARSTLERGRRVCSKSTALWIRASRLEEREGHIGKARTILDAARCARGRGAPGKVPTAPVHGAAPLPRMELPDEDTLWLEGSRLEDRAGEDRAKGREAAKGLLAKGLQRCPKSGVLWAEALHLEPRASKKSKASEAYKRCDTDAHVVVAVARLFWRDRKVRSPPGTRWLPGRWAHPAVSLPPHRAQVDKARSWLQRAVGLDSKLGDAWANLLAFERQHGTEESRQSVVRRAGDAQPTGGDLFTMVAEDPANYGKSAQDLIQLVATKHVETPVT